MFFFAIFSLIASAAGTYMQYQGQKAQAKAAEQAAEYNSKVQQQQAKHESDVAAENARRKSQDRKRKLASLRARAAGSGVSFAGSVMDQIDDNAFTLERDIRDGIYTAQRRTANLQAQSQMTLWEGQTQAQAHRTNASATLLSGAGDMAGSIYGMRGQGALRPTRTSG